MTHGGGSQTASGTSDAGGSAFTQAVIAADSSSYERNNKHSTTLFRKVVG